MSEREKLLDVAERWWASRAPGGAFHKDSGELSADKLDEVTDLEDLVEELVEDAATLGGMLEALAASAPDEERQAYIGTWHLENAYEELGLKVFEILDSTQLDLGTKKRILSGFHF